MTKVGFSCKEIKVENQMLLAGYNCERLSQGVHDPLYCRTIVFELRDKKMCFAQFDVLCIGDHFINDLKERVSRYGIESENLIVGAIHTHSAPKGLCAILGIDGIFGDYNNNFIQLCADIFEKCLTESLENMSEFNLKISTQEINGVCSERHSLDNPYDNVLWKIEINRNDLKKILIYNFSCHPTVLHDDNLKISADIPGYVNQYLSDKYDMVMFYNGSAGDISTRFTRKSSDFNEVERLGKILADQILNNAETLIYEGELNNCELYHKSIVLNSWDEEHFDGFKKYVNKLKEEMKYDSSVQGEYYEACQNFQHLETINQSKGKQITLTFSIIKLEQCVIVTIPSEITSSLTLSLTKKYRCMIFSYTGGYHLYLPSVEAYDRKHYESAVSIIGRGEGEKLIAFIDECLKEMNIKKGEPKMVVNKYLDFALEKLQEVKDNEVENINAAADLVVETVKKGGRFYVFGSGHSHMVAEEIYIRAGGLAYVKAILPEELMLHQMPNKSTYLERLEGYSEAILNLYKVDENDTLMVISNSGRNPVPVEMCLEAKKRGTKVITIQSVKHGKATTSRHSSGKMMNEFADVVIDNHAEKGDAAFYIDGFNVPTGPTSDMTGIAIAQSLIAGVIGKLVDEGIEPPVFKSSNIDGADEYNDALFDKYYGYWK